jgi:hypothetical protein
VKEKKKDFSPQLRRQAMHRRKEKIKKGFERVDKILWRYETVFLVS